MKNLAATYDRAFELLGPQPDAVLLVPPYADLYYPQLGVHLLQAAAERAGLRVRILYANLLFAALTGEELYHAVCVPAFNSMWGERIFAAAAFGLPPLGHEIATFREQIAARNQSQGTSVTFDQLAAVERQAGPFCSALAERFASLRLRVVGATTTFQQTAAAAALLAHIKRVCPAAITIIGGANCEGEMAHGIASLGAPIDYIFSGECESAFPDFLGRVVAGLPLPTSQIVQGEPCVDMDSLPEPCFDDYFAQLDNALPSRREGKHISLLYESSRGCWWGARQHCTFCGLNGETIASRQKSPERVIAGAKRLLLRYPSQRLFMTDNILPHSYFRTVLPRLKEELPPVDIFYEAKANLTLEQVCLLRSAGVRWIQPGIESLSSSLLRRMKKGVLARQNLALLRYGRATSLSLIWNLLYRFPGDQPEDYRSTLSLLPLLHHLHPPRGLYPVNIHRFSPYFSDPAGYGISPPEPIPAYAWSFPDSADLHSLAYYFRAEYDSALVSHPELFEALNGAVREWQDSWKAGPRLPALSLTAGNDGYYSLTDTRGLEGAEVLQFLDREEARAVLIGGPLEQQPLADWAISRKLAVNLDGWCVPLAVADAETWRRLEVPAEQPILPVLATASY